MRYAQWTIELLKMPVAVLETAERVWTAARWSGGRRAAECLSHWKGADTDIDDDTRGEVFTGRRKRQSARINNGRPRYIAGNLFVFVFFL